MKRDARTLLVALVAVPALVACQLGGSGNTSRGATPTGASAAAGVPSATAITEGNTGPAPTQAGRTNVALNQPGASPAKTSTVAAGPAQGNGAQSTAVPSIPGVPGSEEAVPQVVRSVSNAVVQIIVQTPQGQGTGSGFIIDKESHIITNNHVVGDATKIYVVLNGNKIERARRIGTDPLSDIAVVQIEPKNLPTVRLGDSNRLQVGEPLIAIGSALGIQGAPTVSTGVVSALKRTAEEPPEAPGKRPVTLVDLIQTDTAINPGNSGGPLLNLRGEVVGINTLGQRQTESGVPVQGINYAVSINTARSVAGEIMSKGEATYPFMGVSAAFVTPMAAIRNNIPYIPGQLIDSVSPGTPADKAGLRAGDTIVAIDGQRITDESTFIVLLRNKEPGDKVTLTVLRKGQERQVTLTLIKRPANLDR
jgi:S1-C subfamily serine protease